jgi:hypothetical protein
MSTHAIDDRRRTISQEDQILLEVASEVIKDRRRAGDSTCSKI